MLTIRPAPADDTPALSQLRAAWAAEQQNVQVEDPDFESSYRAWQENNPRTVFVAEDDDVLIGMLHVMVYNRMPKPGKPSSCWVYVGNAYVLPRNRNDGVGGKLMEAAIEYSRSIGAARIVLSPSSESLTFYERFGFRSANELLVKELHRSGK